MYVMNFSENVAKLRRKKKLTQEQLADFIGVTKASVSKWETKQSMPDVILLPRLATFFDVTIDELLGYEPQLGKEQIQKWYLDLSQAFAKEEFEEVMERCNNLVKQYYSCYDFLTQIVVLWLNHYMIPGGTRSLEILKQAEELCNHILDNCKDIGLCNDVVVLKASVCLQMEKPLEVIEALEEVLSPCRLAMQGEGALIGAYMQVGNMEKANDFTQISMYNHLIALISEASQYIMIHQDNLTICEETEKRIQNVAQAYHVDELNFNIIAIFQYQMAVVYCAHGENEKALKCLQKFVQLSDNFLENGESHLVTDFYFDKLDVWFEKLTLGGNIPRDKRLIYESLAAAVNSPAFESLKEDGTYQNILALVKKKGESLCQI